MRLLFQGSCPKNPGGDDINEDRWAIDEASGTLALCDGASESFDSAVWAQILAEKFISDPAVTSDWIASSLSNYVGRHDFSCMSWSQQASYERGSFSTLLGIQHIPGNKTVEVLAVGDSLALLIIEDLIVTSWPYTDPERFQDRPTLFATLPEHNAFVSGPSFWTKYGRHFDLSGMRNAHLICVTDALGEWVLRHAFEGAAVSRLLSLASEEELVALVLEERSAGRMRTDDSTLLVIAFDEEG
jgi:hypothetical protein